MAARNSKTFFFFLLITSLCSGCSTHRLATPHVLFNNEFTVDPILVALNRNRQMFVLH